MSSRNLHTRIATALAFLLLSGCGATDRSNTRESEQEFIERMREEDMKDERRSEKEQEERRRYEEKVERLSQADDRATEKAHVSRSKLDIRRMQLAYARYYIYSEFEFDSDGYGCPPEAPIKGNEPWGSNGYLFHKPGWVFYGATIPEECFATEAQARKHGFRPSKIRR